MKLSVAILTGGRSARMGRDKALLKVNNDTFLDRLIKEFSSFDEVIVSQASEEDCFLWEDTGNVRNVFDVNKGIGPVEGILRSLTEAKNQHVFVCAVDMPFMRHELAEYMAGYVSSDYDAYVITDRERMHPLCAIYSKEMILAIKTQIEKGCYKLKMLLDMVRTKYISIEDSRFSRNLVLNVNTMQEYEDVLKGLYECGDEKWRRASSQPMVFAVSGIKNSGKTTMIEGLLGSFIKRGLSCNVIKHDCHGYKMDYDGSDTDRFYKKGARLTAIYNDEGFSINSRECVTADKLMWEYCDSDVIILEGAKALNVPKIVLSAKGDASEYEYAPCIIGIAVDETAGERFDIKASANDEAEYKKACLDRKSADVSAVEIYDRNDYDGICEALLKYFKKE